MTFFMRTKKKMEVFCEAVGGGPAALAGHSAANADGLLSLCVTLAHKNYPRFISQLPVDSLREFVSEYELDGATPQDAVRIFLDEVEEEGESS